MTQENVQNFYHIIQVILRSAVNDDERNAATNKAMEMIQQKGAIFDLFVIIPQSPDKAIRQFAMILVEKIEQDGLHLYSPEEIQQIKIMLINFIQNEVDFFLRCKLCELASILMEKKAVLPWPEIYEFSNQLLTNPNLFTTGLYLWHLIAGSLNSQEIAQVAPLLVQSCQTAMSSDSSEMRINGTKLLMTLLWQNSVITKGDCTPLINTIIESILAVIKKTFYESKDVNEAHEIARNLSEVFSSPYQCLDHYHTNLAQVAIQILACEELPLEIRLAGYEIIDIDENMGGCISLLEEFNTIDKIAPYLNLIINIMGQLLRIERDSSLFEFAAKFFSLAGATIEGNFIFAYIMQSVTTLYQQNDDLVSRMVGLFLLTNIVESQQEYFCEHIAYVVKYIVQVADVNDEYVLSYAFRLLQELVEFVPQVLTICVDGFTVLIMRHIAHHDALTTLFLVLNACKRPPRELHAFLNFLIQLLGQANAKEQVEGIILCMAASISSAYHPIEEFYNAICPVLNSALTMHNDLQKPVLRCFGDLSTIAPLSTQAEVEKIIELVKTMLSMPDLSIASEAVCTLRKFAINIPLSLIPFLQEIVPILISLLQANVKPSADQSDISSDDIIIVIQSELFQCFAALINSLPQHMSSVAPQFYDLLQNVPKTNDKMTIPVCKSIRMCASGYKSLGINLFEAFKPIMNQLANSDNKETIIETHKTITKLIYIYGRNLTNEYMRSIHQQLTNGIGGTYFGYLICELSGSIYGRIVAPAFKCLNQLIATSGSSFTEDLAQETIKCIDPFLTSPSKLSCGYAIEVYAHILLSTGLNPELFQVAAQTALFNLCTKTFIIHISLCRSIRLLLSVHKDAFIPTQESLIRYAEGFVRSTTSSQIESEKLKRESIALWCALIMQLEIAPNEEILDLVLLSIPPPNCEVLTTISLFIDMAMKRWPDKVTPRLPFISASLLASEDTLIMTVPQPIIAVFLQVLASVPQNELGSLVGNNQGHLVKLMYNLQKLTTPQQ
ncbi:hypothetical protein TRFO_16983 [Tritrichomonas foetus]|uniref:Importin N-terminal domain-containing protein n=1 Tax=Tritrichomonas foetus TaxID=1144522 RepID=A0A1J4KNY0_9EUKA|nr:hypothetical protein TRFO_16983 [Tritrichomonas foetus]|eukprot:OHT12939.1 hypothetical protein TRFO_16983 [Tritrichomonas foetus]